VSILCKTFYEWPRYIFLDNGNYVSTTVKGLKCPQGKVSPDTLSLKRLYVSQYRFYPGYYMVFVSQGKKLFMMNVVIIQYYTCISLDTLPSCQVCDHQHCISTNTEEVIYLVQYGSSFGHIHVPDIRRCWRKDPWYIFDFCLKSINIINWQETWPKGRLTFWGHNYISLLWTISKSSEL
jgi:hypothetical protein